MFVLMKEHVIRCNSVNNIHRIRFWLHIQPNQFMVGFDGFSDHKKKKTTTTRMIP